MNRELIATTSISIHATDVEVWDALINPAKIQQYLLKEALSSWDIGSPILFHGEWKGLPYTDKGVILEINPLRILSYSLWSSLSGTEDFEDNYSHVSYHLAPFNDNTILVITQDNLPTDALVVQAEEYWMQVGIRLKMVVEQNKGGSLSS